MNLVTTTILRPGSSLGTAATRPISRNGGFPWPQTATLDIVVQRIAFVAI